LATQAQKIAEIESKVNSVAAELRFQETLMARTESIISDIAELTSELKSKAAVQDERMGRMLEELKHNHEDIEDLRRSNLKQDTELLNKLDRIEERSAKRFEAIEERMSTLEQYKWFIIGAVTVISFLMQMAGELMHMS
jgi:DNA repair exonuclease SbcCD ATPase subunit